MRKSDRPNIFSYLDYRAFMQDMFDFKQKENSRYSYRYFADKIGLLSTNYFSLVIKGKRNISLKTAIKIGRGFGLKKMEQDFFQNLVLMNNATDHDQKNYYYQKMIASPGFMKIKKVDKSSYEYFSKWYYPVIREIVEFGDRRHSPEQIAALLNPKILPPQAKKALRLLQELGLIGKDAEGRWEKCSTIVDTGPEVRSLTVSNFHKEMLKLATESIDRHSSDQRDISGMVLSIKYNGDTLKQIKKEIDTFRKRIAQLPASDTDADHVMYIGMQMFPLTNRGKDEE